MTIDVSMVTLSEEMHILSKVLVRNANQHGRTKIFGYLRRAYKTVDSFMLSSDVVALSLSGEQCLRAKVSLRDLTNSIRTISKQRNVIRSAGEVIFCALKAFILLRDSLRKQLYVPLFSTLLAQCARITMTTAQLYQHFHVQEGYLTSHLRSASVTHLQHAEMIRKAFHGQNAGTWGTPPRVSVMLVDNLVHVFSAKAKVNMKMKLKMGSDAHGTGVHSWESDIISFETLEAATFVNEDVIAEASPIPTVVAQAEAGSDNVTCDHTAKKVKAKDMDKVRLKSLVLDTDIFRLTSQKKELVVVQLKKNKQKKHGGIPMEDKEMEMDSIWDTSTRKGVDNNDVAVVSLKKRKNNSDKNMYKVLGSGEKGKRVKSSKI